MRPFPLLNAGILSLALVLGIGCPAPPDAEGPTAGQPGPGGAPPGPPPGGGAAGPPPADGAVGPPPGADGAPPAGGAPGDGPPPPAPGTAAGEGGSPPPPLPEGAEPAKPVAPQGDFAEAPAPGKGFGKLIDGGASVTITGTITGAKDVQVDFLSVGEFDGMEVPKIIHIERVSGNSFKITAPAKYADPIYVTALKDLSGDGPSPDDTVGFAAEPITLSGSDLSVTIAFGGAEPAWAKKLFSPPPDGKELPPPPDVDAPR